ncbi:DUF1566 domain-containing protein [Thiothrix subterranea]|uniref:Lcl C-terminal domain-containing protein n=1 Tax=Thiothrix subterranea TaxID=2735563 RepID=UPI00192AD250|nr:DUF1566 domain-containing protein [Thiothrix subterranea]QQZ28859.1 DUF1566 domain-containing protein [Thiothrix subterranea]
MRNVTHTLMAGILLVLPVIGYSQVCNNAIVANTPDTSFNVDDQNGTVTDKQTGLMWKRCAEGQAWDSVNKKCNGTAVAYNWQAMFDRAAIANQTPFAGKIGWRLANIKELESIIETRCYAPAINATAFPDSPLADFWSSSIAGGGFAWFLNFDVAYNGSVFRDEQKYVRLVRVDE